MVFKENFKETICNADVHYLSEGIVHIHYKEGSTYTVVESEKIFTTINTKTNLQKVRILLSGGDFVSHDEGSTKYNASDKVMERCSAVAMVTQNLANKLVANFFMRFYKPKSPVKIFSNPEDALNWLRKHSNQPLIIATSYSSDVL